MEVEEQQQGFDLQNSTEDGDDIDDILDDDPVGNVEFVPLEDESSVGDETEVEANLSDEENDQPGPGPTPAEAAVSNDKLGADSSSEHSSTKHMTPSDGSTSSVAEESSLLKGSDSAQGNIDGGAIDDQDMKTVGVSKEEEDHIAANKEETDREKNKSGLGDHVDVEDNDPQINIIDASPNNSDENSPGTSEGLESGQEEVNIINDTTGEGSKDAQHNNESNVSDASDKADTVNAVKGIDEGLEGEPVPAPTIVQEDGIIHSSQDPDFNKKKESHESMQELTDQKKHSADTAQDPGLSKHEEDYENPGSITEQESELPILDDASHTPDQIDLETVNEHMDLEEHEEPSDTLSDESVQDHDNDDDALDNKDSVQDDGAHQDQQSIEAGSAESEGGTKQGSESASDPIPDDVEGIIVLDGNVGDTLNSNVGNGIVGSQGTEESSDVENVDHDSDSKFEVNGGSDSSIRDITEAQTIAEKDASSSFAAGSLGENIEIGTLSDDPAGSILRPELGSSIAEEINSEDLSVSNAEDVESDQHHELASSEEGVTDQEQNFKKNYADFVEEQIRLGAVHVKGSDEEELNDVESAPGYTELDSLGDGDPEADKVSMDQELAVKEEEYLETVVDEVQGGLEAHEDGFSEELQSIRESGNDPEENEGTSGDLEKEPTVESNEHVAVDQNVDGSVNSLESEKSHQDNADDEAEAQISKSDTDIKTPDEFSESAETTVVQQILQHIMNQVSGTPESPVNSNTLINSPNSGEGENVASIITDNAEGINNEQEEIVHDEDQPNAVVQAHIPLVYEEDPPIKEEIQDEVETDSDDAEAGVDMRFQIFDETTTGSPLDYEYDGQGEGNEDNADSEKPSIAALVADDEDEDEDDENKEQNSPEEGDEEEEEEEEDDDDDDDDDDEEQPFTINSDGDIIYDKTTTGSSLDWLDVDEGNEKPQVAAIVAETEEEEDEGEDDEEDDGDKYYVDADGQTIFYKTTTGASLDWRDRTQFHSVESDNHVKDAVGQDEIVKQGQAAPGSMNEGQSQHIEQSHQEGQVVVGKDEVDEKPIVAAVEVAVADKQEKEAPKPPYQSKVVAIDGTTGVNGPLKLDAVRYPNGEVTEDESQYNKIKATDLEKLSRKDDDADVPLQLSHAFQKLEAGGITKAKFTEKRESLIASILDGILASRLEKAKTTVRPPTTVLLSTTERPSEIDTDDKEGEFPVSTLLSGIYKLVQSYITPKPTPSAVSTKINTAPPLPINVHSTKRDNPALHFEKLDLEHSNTDPFVQLKAPNLHHLRPEGESEEEQLFRRPLRRDPPRTISPFNSPALKVQEPPKVLIKEPESPVLESYQVVAGPLPLSAPVAEANGGRPLYPPRNFHRGGQPLDRQGSPSSAAAAVAATGPSQPSFLALRNRHASREPVKIALPDLISREAIRRSHGEENPEIDAQDSRYTFDPVDSLRNGDEHFRRKVLFRPSIGLFCAQQFCTVFFS